MSNTLTRATGVASTTGATIYTVPAGNTATLIGLRCSNKDTSYRTFTVSVAGKQVTGSNCPLPVGSAMDVLVGSKIIAVAGDSIIVTADANSVIDVYISFLLQS